MKMNVTSVLRCAVFSTILIIASFIAEGQPGFANPDNVRCTKSKSLLNTVVKSDAFGVVAAGHIVPSRFVIVK